MTVTLILIACMILLLVSGKLRSDLIGIGSLLFLMLFGVLTPAEALSGFSNPIVLTMVSVFVLGGAILQTGLAQQASKKILKLAGTNEALLMLLVMLVTACIGAFVSNTGTVAIMMPITVSLASALNLSASRFLMPLAFVSNMGGLLTLIGNPPNMVANSALVQAGQPALSMFSFLPLGLLAVATGVLAMYPLSTLFLRKKNTRPSEKKPKDISLDELAHKYHLSENIYKLHVPHDSPISGKSLAQLSLPKTYKVALVALRHADTHPSVMGHHKKILETKLTASSKVYQRDELFVMGSLSNIHTFAEAYELKLSGCLDGHEDQNILAFDGLGICELVLLSTSRYVGMRVADTDIRKHFNISLLGIQRKNQLIIEGVREQILQPGDSLLIQGSWESIGQLDKAGGEWVIMGRPLEQAFRAKNEKKMPLVACILLLTIAALAFKLMPTVTAMMLAAFLVILAGCFRTPEDGYSYINWESVILIASMLPVALALEKVGAITLVAKYLTASATGLDPHMALAAVYVTTSIMAMVMGNTAASLLIAPVAIKIALALGYSPYPFAFAVAAGASLCFGSPFSTPANALVISAGRYSFLDFIKVGVPLQVILALVMIIALPLLFPF